MGMWILETACHQIASWQAGLSERLSISVNLSARQLMHPLLMSQVEDILDAAGLDPWQLKLEVTESTVMEYRDKAEDVLMRLDRLGVHLSTDDFGTGYSSLSYLQSFPFDRLKIDRSFVDKLGRNRKSDAIVKTILMLGTNLGMEVVAEGIETAAQLESLQELGCRFGQGYYFSRPVDADEAEKLIRTKPTGFFLAPFEEMVELAGVQ
jgi:EAL domain-containing protein (putative c-di-GMP-specific phosphodiesterase class I)